MANRRSQLETEYFELSEEIETLTQSIEQAAEEIRRIGRFLEGKETVEEIADIDNHLMPLIPDYQMKKDIVRYKEASRQKEEVKRLLNP